jgi:hypothetical protein
MPTFSEGEHFIESHFFKWYNLYDVGDEYIHHGYIHCISVEKGCVANLVGEGDHVTESSQFLY